MNVSPPNPPWKELAPNPDAGGYLSFYYSDNMSALPVRWVTKPGDNKSDPNLETGTYGLFSTCSPGMRSGVVKRRVSHIFFFCRREEVRVVAGYYRIRWFAGGPQGAGDFCLAADGCHFVRNPLSFEEIDKKLETDLAKPFRSTRLISNEICTKLVTLLHQQSNAVNDYVAEIDRLERFNLKHGGYRYVAWQRQDKFSWQTAEKYLTAAPDSSVRISNSSASGLWVCSNCAHIVKNKALLKQCPACKNLGTLRPSIVGE